MLNNTEGKMREKVASLVSLTTAFCGTSVKKTSDILRAEHLGWVQTHPQAVLLHFFSSGNLRSLGF